MKSLIPGFGEKTSKKRIKELEEEAGTLPVIFALLFTESIKIAVVGLPTPFFPDSSWFHFIGESLKFLFMAVLVGVLYVFEEERKMYKEKASDVKDKAAGKASETAETVSQKAKDVKDSNE